MKHGIVIPCYNEASRLDLKSFTEFAENFRDICICFVNDGSSDATRSTLAKIRNQVSENVLILNVEENAGKANAVRQGALLLFRETEVDTIGFLDADLSTSFEDYGRLLKEYENAKGKLKVIFGSRNLDKKTGQIERNPIRNLISVCIGQLIFGITRLKIADTQCGAKVFDKGLIPMIYKESFFSRWLFDVEILLRLKERFGVANFLQIFLEKPLKKWVHVEDSKLGLRDSVLIPLNLFHIWREYELKPLFQRVLSNLSPITIKI